ncbi:FecR family protein [Chitinophaga vietnamensis]|uniref:FecR family protein n=1 Tax=Chitinophaga vietnamensis TaxID=2593957 RepID=UPI0013757E4B|nr:FecR family protein [Chitinophaga vietnamensis]
MNQGEIISIIGKYAQGITLSPEEAQLLASWLHEVAPADFHATLDQCENVPEEFRAYPAMPEAAKAALEARLDQLDLAEEPAPRPGFFVLYGKKIAVAATLALMVIAGSVVYKQYRKARPEISATQRLDPAPGGNRAVLTLADGSTIVLDSAHDGVLSQQGGTKVIKLASGKLAYNTDGTSGPVQYNTITTPNGGQYHIELPDGSHVWLNAASSLRFPASMNGTSRMVELTGEAYFDVAASAGKPFSVKMRGGTVDVLGTQFNVNAYAEEAAVKTTLLKGAVRINGMNGALQLSPGQQGQLIPGANPLLAQHADIEQAVAWKNGYFQFDGNSLPELMRQIARWYDLSVVYVGQVPDHEFTGKISRAVYLSEVLKALELSDVHCKLNGKQLIVMQ